MSVTNNNELHGFCSCTIKLMTRLRKMLTVLLLVTGAHNPERLTSILRLCNGVFTSRFIFR